MSSKPSRTQQQHYHSLSRKVMDRPGKDRHHTASASTISKTVDGDKVTSRRRHSILVTSADDLSEAAPKLNEPGKVPFASTPTLAAPSSSTDSTVQTPPAPRHHKSDPPAPTPDVLSDAANSAHATSQCATPQVPKAKATQSKKLPRGTKHAFFSETLKSFGKTALILQGGGIFGMF